MDIQSIKHWTYLYACRKAHALIVWLSTLVVIGHWTVSRHGMFVHQWEQNGTPPPLLILSGYHSDRTLGWEFGFEFSRRRKKPKGQKHREGGAGHGETFVLVILKNYTWGWRGNKKNVFWLEWMKGSRNVWEWIAEKERGKKNMFLFELRQWPWVTDVGLFGFKCAILRCFVPTGL